MTNVTMQGSETALLSKVRESIRPINALMEFVDNSIDAGATKIDISYSNNRLSIKDNGKGMSASIIENYLLKIGNSYYQSPDFYQSQAETGFVYTPTSQFGIGILSCFIIGDRIEIVTKEDNGNYIACSIDGPSEFFYYKKTLYPMHLLMFMHL